MVEGYSQWLFGLNMTRKCNHLHIADNRIQLPVNYGVQDFLSLIDSDTHSFIPLNRLFPATQNSAQSESVHISVASLVGYHASSSSDSNSLARPLRYIAHIIKRLHAHVCGLASYGDMRTLLQRNKLWNNDVKKILTTTVENCQSCIATAPPPSHGKVSITNINRNFNDVVCVDHFWLEETCCFHIMD